MGNYLAAADIQAYYIGLVFSTSTQPTLLEVGAWIDEAEAIIDGSLAQAYVVPVTNATDIKQLKTLAAKYVLDNVNFTMGKSNFNITQNQVLVPRKVDHKGFYELLGKYTGANPTLTLPNTSRQSSDSKLVTKSYTQANAIEPVALKETDQW